MKVNKIMLQKIFVSYFVQFRIFFLKRQSLTCFSNILLLVFILPFVSLAQQNNLVFRHITNRDGLSNSTVNCIHQDSYGFMWFGTQDGLNRYDGYEFEIYRNRPDDTLSVSSGWIETVYEDSEKNLWIGTSNGLNLYNRESNSFTRFINDSKKNSLSNNHVRQILEEDGFLWIATVGGGLNLYDKKTGKFKYFANNAYDASSLGSDWLWCVHIDSTNRLWVGTTGAGLNLLDRENKTFRQFLFDPKLQSINSINCIYELSRDKFLIGTDGGLVCFDFSQNGKFRIYTTDNKNENSIPGGHVRKIFKDASGNLWIAAQYGLCIYNEKTDSFTRILNSKISNNAISTDEVWDIFQDNQESMWFGTFKGGLNVLYTRQLYFHYCGHNPNDVKTLTNNSVMSFTENPDGTIWLGIDHGGLCLFDKKNGVLKSFRENSKNPCSITSDAVVSVFLDSENELWVGSWGGGVNKFNKKTQCFESFTPTELLSKEWNIWFITEDYKGRMWFGSGAGLTQYDKKNKTFKTYTHDNYNPTSLSHRNVWTIYEDKKNTLWIGTSTGLNKYNEATDDFTCYPFATKNCSNLGSYRVYSIYEDSKNRFWVGTGGNGLNLFDRQTGVFTPYSGKDGFENSAIFGIVEDRFTNIWLSTSKGITKIVFDSANNIAGFYSFDEQSGLILEQLNLSSIMKTAEGQFFFGGSNGLIFFHPDSVRPNQHKPKVVLTDFFIFNRKVSIDPNGSTDSPLRKHVNESDIIELNSDQSVFSIKYAALNYISPSKNKYAYMLEGFDKDWNFVENKREATYTNLDAGTYIFRVKAANNDGIWNDNDKSIKIVVLPPWWNTLYFKSFAFIIIVGGGVFFYRYRINKINNLQQMLKQKVRERTKDLQYANLELQDQQEELRELNEQLYARQDELESTLQKLTETQNQLIQSEKMASIAILSAGIAHEINNPLNFIQGGKNILELYLRQNIEIKHIREIEPYLEMINAGVKKATGIVKSLDYLNKKHNNFADKCDIHSMINYCVDMLSAQITNNIEVRRSYAADSIFVLGNEVELRQVFFNVLTNAIQSITESGTVTITTYLVDDRCVIEISDTGGGISQENIKKVIDPFFTTKDPDKASGLGMSIAYSIVRQHNGELEIESDIDKGTKVIIMFNAIS